jgi:two-component system, sensor histidine kinase YesM
MKKRKNKSINRRIVVTFLLIIVIMSVSFLYSNIMKDNIVEEYNLSMKINIKLSNLSVSFNDSFASFDSYMKSPDVEMYKKFLEANGKIENIIEEVEPYVSQDKNSGIYLRNLISMYEWYRQQTYSVIDRGTLDSETYEKYVKIGRMNFYISQHSRNLTSSYLQFTDSYYSNILDKYNTLDTNLYLLLIITIAVSALLIWLVTYDIIRTIINLSDYVKQLYESNWYIPDIEEQTYKEFNNLTKTFNHMKNKLRDFITQLNEKAEIEKNYHLEKLKSAEKDKVIKDTQLKALQMQINPHFLFNNLNTVGRMAMFEEADKTVDLIGALSKILRYNLTTTDKLVSLNKEVENVKAYILIQETKFEDRISFEFNIDKEIEHIKIPPMIIQLLVENAIIHGVSGLDRKGIINVEGHEEEGYVVITVEDNGKGFVSDNEKARMNKTTTGLGLANIRKRLELYFNRSDLLHIQSKEGQGTRISITIPMEDGENVAEDINS